MRRSPRPHLPTRSRKTSEQGKCASISPADTDESGRTDATSFTGAVVSGGSDVPQREDTDNTTGWKSWLTGRRKAKDRVVLSTDYHRVW